MKIPGLSKWNMYAADQNGKHSYDFYMLDPSSPWQGRRQITIMPVQSQYGRHRGYQLSYFPGIRTSGHETIGIFRSPHEAVTTANIYFTQALKNPLTRKETKNIYAEARVHSRIGGGAKTKKAYYKGMSDGMMDIAQEYGKRTIMKNPPRLIYHRIRQIIAVKGPGHRCDAKCEAAGHTYRHIFPLSKKASKVLGNADGSLTVKTI